MFDNLTSRQRAVYEFIRDRIRQRGYGPTVREIGDQFQIKSPNGVMCHLKALEKKGLIRRDANKARAIQLAHESVALHRQPANAGLPGTSDNERSLPFAGVVSAGFTPHAFGLDETIYLDEMLLRQDVFALRVEGDSMIDAHIADGDYVICRSAQSAEPGQMVVALNDAREPTLKFWFPEGDRVRLQPGNAALPPIYVRQAHVRGVVVGVVRTRML